MLLGAKEILEKDFNRAMIGTDVKFDSFQRFTYKQQIRYSFKSLKRFVLEKDINHLNHWDMVSIFVENLERDIIKSRYITAPILDVIESWRKKEDESE